MKRALIALPLFTLMAACASAPESAEKSDSQVLESDVDYKQAYRIISRQFTACKRVIGVFGNGYDVQSDLDTDAQEGRIDYYSQGLTGVHENAAAATQMVVKPSSNGGSVIRVTGTSARHVYADSQSIKNWLNGDLKCGR
ncbi:hypothetical protein ACCQ12_15370 [Xanthomonas sp. NCPPB 1068]|uniref:hypothetical protein n=1 Tax=Xanthomonas sp. NCPPB 1068 TaxID=487525 RepID=UPI003558AA69